MYVLAAAVADSSGAETVAVADGAGAASGDSVPVRRVVTVLGGAGAASGGHGESGALQRVVTVVGNDGRQREVAVTESDAGRGEKEPVVGGCFFLYFSIGGAGVLVLSDGGGIVLQAAGGDGHAGPSVQGER